MHRDAINEMMKKFALAVKQRYCADVKTDGWVMENTRDREWRFGVVQIEGAKIPLLIGVYYDASNNIFKLTLKHQTKKTVQVFPSIYHYFLEMLKSSSFDCLLRNDDEILVPHIYKISELPFHASGKMSEVIVQLFKEIRKQVKASSFALSTVNDSIVMHTPYVKGALWSISTHFDESGEPLGYLSVNGQAIENTAQVFSYFKSLKRMIERAERIEQALIKCIEDKNPKSYYDPHTDTFIIYEKRIPFAVKVNVLNGSVDESPVFARFGKASIVDTDEDAIVKGMRHHINKYIMSDRLKAIVENRF